MHTSPAGSTPESLLAFFSVVSQLKKTKRTGWLLRGIVDGCESVADHMYRMGMIAMVLPMDASINRTHCVMMALVHDLAEAIVGDITPECGVSDAEKHRREKVPRCCPCGC